MMRRAMEYAKDFDRRVDHCETIALIRRLNARGRVFPLLGLKGMPALAEELDAVRDILLAQETAGIFYRAYLNQKRYRGRPPRQK